MNMFWCFNSVKPIADKYLKSIFFENKASYEKILFYFLNLLFRIESSLPDCITNSQIPTVHSSLFCSSYISDKRREISYL